jgi:hypothetical protein
MSIVCKCGQKLNVGRHECSFGEVVEVSMSTKPKKSCIKDTTYDSNCIGCEAVNDEKCRCENAPFEGLIDTSNCELHGNVSVSLPLEERIAYNSMSTFVEEAGKQLAQKIDNDAFPHQNNRDTEPICFKKINIGHDPLFIDEDGTFDLAKMIDGIRLSEREKVVRKVKDLKEWYSGDGNKPIRDALDSIISSLSTPNEVSES